MKNFQSSMGTVEPEYQIGSYQRFLKNKTSPVTNLLAVIEKLCCFANYT